MFVSHDALRKSCDLIGNSHEIDGKVFFDWLIVYVFFVSHHALQKSCDLIGNSHKIDDKAFFDWLMVHVCLFPIMLCENHVI